MRTGDGWTTCGLGHRHWGRFGGAGLLPWDRAAEPRRVLLQLRASWSHHGGTWGLLGGARDADEPAVTTALREAAEESTLDPAQVRVTAAHRDDHDGWAYTTVVADWLGPGAPSPQPRGEESDAVRWWPVDEVARLPLHPGLAAAWPLLRTVGPAPVLLVDAANVMGSRPDGWWRDRAGAARRLRDGLSALATDGVPASALEPDRPVGLHRWPEVVLMLEGQARGVPGVPGVRVVSAPGSGDDTLHAEAAALTEAGRDVVVVTADRELRSRVTAVGARVLGPRTLLDLLPG